MIKWLVANVDEKGYQEYNKLELFNTPVVIYHGEDTLINVLGIEDDLTDFRIDAFFSDQDHKGNFLRRVIAWSTNAADNDSGRRVNALEVFRLMRFLLRLYLELPRCAQAISSDAQKWDLAQLVFYFRGAFEEF